MNILTIQAEALDAIKKICESKKHKDPISDILCEVNRAHRLIGELQPPVKNADHYGFSVKVRLTCGAHVARCNGFTASRTSSERDAAELAAQKAFDAMCRINGIDPKTYLRGSVPTPTGFEVNFTKLP